MKKIAALRSQYEPYTQNDLSFGKIVTAIIFKSLPVMVFITVGVIFLNFITYRSWNFFESELKGEAYDSLASHILVGSAEVACDAIYDEALIINNRCYMYFGAFPALLRILANSTVPSNYGLWSRLSCFIAALFALFGAAAFFWEVRKHGKDRRWELEHFLLSLFIVVFGLTTPLLLLSACGYIFHEAILWGLAASLLALRFVWRIRVQKARFNGKNLFWLSFYTGIALMARPTFAAPLLVISAYLPITRIFEILKKRGKRTTRLFRLVFSMLPLVLSVFFVFWYNSARFGGILEFSKPSAHPYRPKLIDHINVTGAFNPARIPIALKNYLIPVAENFSSTFPFVKTHRADYGDDNLYESTNPFRESVLALSVLAWWLIIGALIGVWKMIMTRRIFYLVLIFAYSTQVALIASYAYIAQRFIAELLPGLLWTFGYFMRDFDLALKTRGTVLISLMVFLVLNLCVLFSIFSVIHWSYEINWGAPEEHRKDLKDFFSPYSEPQTANSLH